jgi:hypothetical protein
VLREYVCLCFLVWVLTAPSLARAGAAARPAGENRVPNFLGATGLLLIPSAYLQHDRQLSAFVAGISDSIAGGVAAGVRNRLELSVAGADMEEFAHGQSGVLANAKLSLVKETLMLPALSVGVVDVFDTLEPQPSWYLVASKYVIRYFVQGLSGQDLALKLHMGFGGGIYDTKLFLGTELFFRGPLAGMAEYANGELNLGGRYSAGHWSATLGLFDLRHVGGGIVFTARIGD